VFPDPKIRCHHTGFARSCREIVAEHDCPKFVQVQGTNKNTGEPINRMGCVDSVLHILQIETQSVMREVSGEVSMHRKEQREQTAQAAQNADALNQNLIRMHGQNAQIALAQIRSGVMQIESSPDEPELPFLEHRN
jgi:hypothetical protein